MKKRIQELYKEAYGYFPCPMGEPETEKFAELIVRECMTVVRRKCASWTAYEALADYFGVEE
jgi:hypothetical protein